MRTRTATAALAAALAILGAGCGDTTCRDETPPLKQAPAACTAQAGTQISVPLRVCPRCDQGAPRCLVHLENVAAGQIALEPVADVCDANPSCPIVDPGTCPFAPLNCTFVAPARPDTYDLVVATPTGADPDPHTLTVVASAAFSCTW